MCWKDHIPSDISLSHSGLDRLTCLHVILNKVNWNWRMEKSLTSKRNISTIYRLTIHGLNRLTFQLPSADYARNWEWCSAIVFMSTSLKVALMSRVWGPFFFFNNKATRIQERCIYFQTFLKVWIWRKIQSLVSLTFKNKIYRLYLLRYI